ncbi:MAG: hemerythrin family protein [Gammaproteobacteria bacterium]|nr:hemerythrin family protein [Gammaproteobacteria bacterium]
MDMPIQWREKLTVGDVATDDEHKHLVCLLNGLEVLVKRYPKKLALFAFLDEVEEEINNHFCNEEALMRKIGYPRFEEHFQAHQRLRQEMKSIRHDMASAEDHEGFVREVIGFMNRIKSWLINHIIEMDKDYAAYVIKARRAGKT